MQGTQLFIRSFELGVMFLPSLEARYQQHPHKGFTCTPQGSSTSTPWAPPDLSARGPAASPSSQGHATSSAGTFGTSKEGNAEPAEHAGTSSTGK